MIRSVLVILAALGGGAAGLAVLAGWWVRRRLRRFGLHRVRPLRPTVPTIDLPRPSWPQLGHADHSALDPFGFFDQEEER